MQISKAIIRRSKLLTTPFAFLLALLVTDTSQANGALPAPGIPGAQTAVHAPPALFTSRPALPSANAAVVREAHVTRSRAVNIDRSLLSAYANSPLRGQLISLNLFDDVTLVAQADRIETTPRGINWIGHVQGVPMSQVVIAMNGEVVAANISMMMARYQLRYIGNGVHEVQRIDQSQFPRDEESVPVPDQSMLDAAALNDATAVPAAQADDGSQIDVMVVYTATARAAAGGTAAMQSLIDLAVSETNQAYQNSGVTQRLRLVRAEEVAYTETGNMNTALNCITSTTDGCLDNVHTLRNTYGADLVSFWVENGGGYCGLGWMMASVSPSFAGFGFNVVARSCATGYYSFGHELGHNMGARHDVYVDSPSTPYSYAHGYTNPGAPSPWRTIMAYNDACAAVGKNCARIQYFSNPTLTYGGAAMGNATADNRQTFNNTASTVANFRASIGTPPPAPTQIAPDGVIESTTPTYSWNPSTGATSYWLFVGNGSGALIIQNYLAAAAGCDTGTGPCSVTPATPLAYDTPYIWGVLASNSNGNSDWSSGKLIMANLALPPAPTLLAPVNTIATQTPTYSWNASAGAASYLLWVGNGSGAIMNQIYTAAALGCGAGTGICSVTPATSLANATSYGWAVLPKNAKGDGPWSSWNVFTVSY